MRQDSRSAENGRARDTPEGAALCSGGGGGRVEGGSPLWMADHEEKDDDGEGSLLEEQQQHPNSYKGLPSMMGGDVIFSEHAA